MACHVQGFRQSVPRKCNVVPHDTVTEPLVLLGSQHRLPAPTSTYQKLPSDIWVWVRFHCCVDIARPLYALYATRYAKALHNVCD